VFCVLESDSIIRILFGTKWLEAAPIFQILALGGIIYPFNGMQALAAMSMGFSKRLMIWGVSSGIIYVIAFIAGLAIGAKGVAIGFTIATTIIAIFSLFYCLHGTPISPLNFLSAQIPPLLICLIAAIGVLVTEQLWPGFSLIRTGAILLIFFSIYVVLSFLNKSIREAATLILKEVFHK
jgi:PST family polysaccharide transporter